MIFLTTIERIILESLRKSPKKPVDVIQDTGIKGVAILNAMESLIVKKLVIQNRDIYQLTIESKQKLTELMNDKPSLNTEIQELLNYSLSLSIKEKRGDFALKKVYLNDKESKIVNSLFADIQDYIEQVAERPKNHSTKDEKVIFWGANQYSDIIDYASEQI